MNRLFRNTGLILRQVIVCLVSALFIHSLVVRAGDSAATAAHPNVAPQLVPIQLEPTAGALKTEHGTGGTSLAVLDHGVRLDRLPTRQIHAPAAAGTQYQLISPLLYSETASSRL